MIESHSRLCEGGNMTGTAARNRTVWWGAGLFALSVSACADSRPAPPPDGTPGPAGPANTAGTSAPPSAGTPDQPIGGGVENSGAGSDRCLSGACGAAVLPVQPEVAFLSEAGDGWLRLIQADWELVPGSEGYRCVRRTVPEDVYITAFKPLSPVGTHHTALVVDREPSEPDGVTVCGVLVNGERRLQGVGAGTGPISLPDGVAMKVAAGDQLLMNLHLFNPNDGSLSGTSGMLVKTAAAEAVEHEAEVILAGPLSLHVPPGEVTQTGGCTLRSPATLFSVGPHMHQLGVHMKIIAHSSIVGERVVHDDAFAFDHQLQYQIDEVPLAAGDRVSLECMYMNDTGRIVRWGDSSLDEMCFASLGLYPAIDFGGFPCTR